MHLKFLKRRDSGMTLVETMAAAAISSAIILVVSQGMITTNKTAKGINLKSNWENLLNVLKTTLSSQTACTSLITNGGPYTFTSGGPPSPGQTPSPLPITTLATSTSTFLTTGTTLNSIYPQSIMLKEVPGFSTAQATTSTYTDYVYLEIKAKKVINSSDASMSVNYDLFSGYTSPGGTPMDALVFIVTKNSSGVITGCEPAPTSQTMQCTDLDPSAQYLTQTESGHTGHNDPNCQLTTLRLAADQIPGTSSATPSIIFGDLYLNNNTTTANNPAPDSISDNLKTNTLSIAAGTLQMQLSTSANVGIGSASPQAKLDVLASGVDPLRIANTTTTSLTQMDLVGTGRTFATGVGNGAENTYGVANKWFVVDRTANNMRMVIDTNGNVGIGTTSPSYLLNVAGSVGIQNNLTVSGTSMTVNGTALVVSGTTSTSSVTVNSNGLIAAACTLNTCNSPSSASVPGFGTIYYCACSSSSQVLISGGADCLSQGISTSSFALSSSNQPIWVANCNASGWGSSAQPSSMYAYCCTSTK